MSEFKNVKIRNNPH